MTSVLKELPERLEVNRLLGKEVEGYALQLLGGRIGHPPIFSRDCHCARLSPLMPESHYHGDMSALPDPRAAELPRRRLTTGRVPLPVVDETSAGGLVVDVVDGMAYAAVIARRNRAGRLEWCLPKGHLEGTETAPEAAVREIFEETGIHGRVLRHLATIDYWFAGTDRRVHKVVHHYLLEALGGELTTLNDPDQEAEDVAWIHFDDVATRLAYPNERRVVATAWNLLTGRP